MPRRIAFLLGRLILPLALALPCAAPAQERGASTSARIAFVSTERILRDSAPAVRAQKRLEAEFEKRRQELARMQEQLRRAQEELERNALTMSESQRRAKEHEFAQLNRDFQRKEREFREDANQRRNEELALVIDQANRVIRQIAEQEKYDIIFQEMPAYVSPRIDITDKVMKALEAKSSAK
ncbi:MAG TPA: OmpH family outer membrane protein [Burkholderiales bacterium]